MSRDVSRPSSPPEAPLEAFLKGQSSLSKATERGWGRGGLYACGDHRPRWRLAGKQGKGADGNADHSREFPRTLARVLAARRSRLCLSFHNSISEAAKLHCAGPHPSVARNLFLDKLQQLSWSAELVTSQRTRRGSNSRVSSA